VGTAKGIHLTPADDTAVLVGRYRGDNAVKDLVLALNNILTISFKGG
jgi:hypothetical protein